MTTDDLRCLVEQECGRLAKLGADGMAREFASRGIQGRQEHVCECPLARALADTLMMTTGPLSVHNDGVKYLQPDGLVAALAAFREGLRPLRDFVEAFDNGDYPHLVQEEERAPSRAA